MSGAFASLEGVVTAMHSGGLVSVDVTIAGETRTVLTRRKNRMRTVTPGDRVRVELADASRGWIVERLTEDPEP